MERKICQSCGMPMESKEDFGTEKDGSASDVYCQFCYANGEFLDDAETPEEKAEQVAKIVAKIEGMTEEEALYEARKMVPTLRELKRWKK